jgi:hypothetical protein
MNFNFEELGIETVEYERFRDILTGYVQICVDQNYENNQQDLLRFFEARRITDEKFSQFLKDNPDFHNESDSNKFDFIALNISLPSDVYFYNVKSDGVDTGIYIINV